MEAFYAGTSLPERQRRRRKSGRSKGAHISASTSIVLAIAITLALKSKLIECRKGSTVLSNDSILSSQATLRRFSYLELLRATNNFSENNIIGIGGFGSVYGGRLEDGIKIAIKVFHQQCASALKSFEAECEVLKNIRHRNLIKVISSCSNDDFKALVLEYMSNGSLGDWLHSSNYVFNIFQRLNIMIDVASSLEYLHFDHSTAIIHCDLKPSNVLLDENMVAHLSDFGIAKLLRGEDESMMRAKTLATIGYMAPEYGIEGEVSTKSDVYSYGIMLMETFTKKKPTDEIFVGELSLKRWVNDLLPNSLVEVVDKTLLSGEEKLSTAKDQCLLSIFILALECTMESPEKRINAKDIVTGLLKIRDTLSKRIGNLS
ncbi:probable LRR receptor-like serine/threonine-protein kinase At3g47570 [Citrus sinensis]|uniref:probable LRR receptor-like serine/threonine-protein kinase At3g47570 n=1 Tax=Citrus sinensis TaxID=2711 RepID=UPI002278E0A0|nr:probable LRR receptor-like serine/threonine-protein kinase At3g47570 [Citrus sinensis]